MSKSELYEEISHPRRRFFGTAAVAFAAAQFGMNGGANLNPARQNRRIDPRSSRARTHRLPH
jgi:hypothetical protein